VTWLTLSGIALKFPVSVSVYSQRMTHKPISKLANEFFKKMEDHAKAEGVRLRKPTHGKLRLIGTAIGVVVVILLAVWMAYHR
jgi:hypothetical protein